jgi:hypothetical protein
MLPHTNIRKGGELMTKETNSVEEAAENQRDEAAETGADTESELTKEKLAQLEETVAAKNSELTTLKEALADAVARYRAILLVTSPGVPEELLAGETVEEIDASLEQAQRIVSKVQLQLDNDVALRGIPAGAPPRMPADLSSLSPEAKIAHALTTERR